MIIIYNDEITKLPNDFMTVADLAEWKNLKNQGTAIAVNDLLIPKTKWSVTRLKEQDRVTVITAAYGG